MSIKKIFKEPDENKMRVLHLRSSGGMLGAERVIIELAKESLTFGYEGIIGALKNVDDPTPEFLSMAESYGIQTKIFECNRSFDIGTALNIKEFIENKNVKILHCHGYKENFYGLMAGRGIPKVATNHLWKTSTLKAKFYCVLDAFAIRFYNKIIGVSDEIVQQMHHIGINRAFKIANGIDCQQFNIKPESPSFRKKYSLRPDDFVLGMISSLSYEKNHQAALSALFDINHPKLKLLIVGSGALENDLKKKVKELGLQKKVVFTGAMSNISDALSAITIFLIPSLNEGLPMALLEAMASGKAVVASNVGEIGNVVEHHKNGLLIETHDDRALGSSIKFYLENQKKVGEYGNAARLTVERKFTSEIMAHSYCKVYDSLLS